MRAEGPLPRYRDLPEVSTLGSARSAWGLFGELDEVGTLNLITPDVVRRAAALVRWGTVFPLNWRIDLPDPPVLGRGAVRRIEKDLDPGTDDYYDNYYPQASSQWDALRHVGHPTLGYYNGLPLDDAGRLGSSHLGIDKWAERGIAGRFVLLDVDRYRAVRGAPLSHDERTPISSTSSTKSCDHSRRRSNVAISSSSASAGSLGTGSSSTPGGRCSRLPISSPPRAWTPRSRQRNGCGIMVSRRSSRTPQRSKRCRSTVRRWRGSCTIDWSHSSAWRSVSSSTSTAWRTIARRTVSTKACSCAAPMNYPGGSGSSANALAIK